MQLSAPNTSTDPQLAAFLAATGRTPSLDGTSPTGNGAGVPMVFAQMLTGATPATGVPATTTGVSGALTAPSVVGAMPDTNFSAGRFQAMSFATTIDVASDTPVANAAPTSGKFPVGAALTKRVGSFIPMEKNDPKTPVPSAGSALTTTPQLTSQSVAPLAPSPAVKDAQAQPAIEPVPAGETASDIEMPNNSAPTVSSAVLPPTTPRGFSKTPIGLASSNTDESSVATIGGPLIATARPLQVGKETAPSAAGKTGLSRSTGKKSSLSSVSPEADVSSGAGTSLKLPSPLDEKTAASPGQAPSKEEKLGSTGRQCEVSAPASNTLVAPAAISLPQQNVSAPVAETKSAWDQSRSVPSPTTVPARGVAFPDRAVMKPAASQPISSNASSPFAASNVVSAQPVATPTALAPVAFDALSVGTPTPAASALVEMNSSGVQTIAETIATDEPAAIEVPTGAMRENPESGSSRAIRFENSVPTRTAILAAFDGNFSSAKNPAPNAVDKTFLNASDKRVATHDLNLGIAVAKSEAVMPTATLSDRAPTVAPLERAVVTPATTTSTSPAGMIASEPSIVAHRAVDAVMTAVERFSAGDRHTVQLQFSVGGADLAVRVELRGDEVRTTFRTDSPELRSALAHEWQAATPDAADRSVRIAAPVFSSNDSANLSAFSGDTASRQQDGRSRRAEAEDIFSSVAARVRGPISATSPLDSTASAAPIAAATALHLSTLA